MTKKLVGRIFAQLIIIGLVTPLMLESQTSRATEPKVATVGVPCYPALARAAHVEGLVHIKITTDGQRVITAHAEDGNTLLAAAAEENAKTWRFVTHEPVTFTVTYRYRIFAELKGDSGNPTITLRLPTDVEISTIPMVINDPGAQTK